MPSSRIDLSSSLIESCARSCGVKVVEGLNSLPPFKSAAYAALLNGGRLFKPSTTFTPQLRAQLSISDDERSILLEGMRGAVTFGTAQKAGLDSLPAYVVGKTGTSTPLQGFRTHGWFVGVA